MQRLLSYLLAYQKTANATTGILSPLIQVADELRALRSYTCFFFLVLQEKLSNGLTFILLSFCLKFV